MKAKYQTLIVSCLLLSITLSGQSNYINQGNKALISGDYTTAEELYNKAIDECDEHDNGQHNLAILAAESGDKEKALDILNKCVKENKTARAYYNRAVIHFANDNYLAAIEDLKVIANSKELHTGQLEDEAHGIKRKTEEKQIIVYDKLGDKELAQRNYDAAIKWYDKAMALTKEKDFFFFKKSKVGVAQKNPFVSLENAEAIHNNSLNEARVEIDLIKAHSLGRINRMKEGIAILENLLFYEKVEDPRIQKLLGYYYLRLHKYDKVIRALKGSNFTEANTYVIAGNAAFYQKKYRLASQCFQYAKDIESSNINAELGTALCLAGNNQYKEAIKVIDALADIHPDNYYVLNTKGIIYKDMGLYHKNRHNSQKAKGYFLTAAAAFISAQKINQNLSEELENNRALALFFLDKNVEAKELWLVNNNLSSQNNLALYYASTKDYKAAYNKLKSLSKKYEIRQKRKHQFLEYNRNLARSRTKLNNNYKFITNYFLTQDKPLLVVDNPFTIEQSDIASPTTLDFILATSDKDCSSKPQANKRKKKKRKRFRLFKRKKKKYNGDCPSF